MRRFHKQGSRRRFSEEFKKQRVKEFEKGISTVREISRTYQVSLTAVYKWLYKYSYFYKNNLVIVEEADSKTEALAKAEKRIEELERLLGKKEMSIDYLEMLIKVASEEYNVDLKKSLDTKHSKK